jgi:hypothetical protein
MYLISLLYWTHPGPGGACKKLGLIRHVKEIDDLRVDAAAQYLRDKPDLAAQARAADDEARIAGLRPAKIAPRSVLKSSIFLTWGAPTKFLRAAAREIHR